MKTVKQKWKKLCQDLKPMPFLEKVDHIWTYFKTEMYFALLAIMILVIVITGIVNVNRKVLISGVIVNALDLEAQVFITDRFVTHTGINQDADLMTVYYADSENEKDISDTYNYMIRVIGMVETQTVDYLIMDQVGLEGYMPQDFFIDMSELLTPQRLDELATELVYMEYEETGDRIPVAIRLNNTAFGHHYLDEEDCYLSFVATTQKQDICKVFLEYLLEEENYDFR